MYSGCETSGLNSEQVSLMRPTVFWFLKASGLNSKDGL